MCDCGVSVESAQHIHLDCHLYSDLQLPLFRAIDTWLEHVRDTESTAAGRWEHMDRAEALRWVHHNVPLVTDPLTAALGAKVRQAALVFYSQVQQKRYATGRCSHTTDMGPQASISLTSPSPGPQGLG